MTFTIRNQPSWAEFDTTTGRLFGRPQFRDIGNYDGITITATNRVKEDYT